MTTTPQQLTYPVPLQIEWKTEPFPDSSSGALIVRDPNTLLAKLGFQASRKCLFATVALHRLR